MRTSTNTASIVDCASFAFFLRDHARSQTSLGLDCRRLLLAVSTLPGGSPGSYLRAIERSNEAGQLSDATAKDLLACLTRAVRGWRRPPHRALVTTRRLGGEQAPGDWRPLSSGSYQRINHIEPSADDTHGQ